MSDLITVAIAETSVLTTALLSCFGFLYRSNSRRQDAQDAKLASITTDVAVIVSQWKMQESRAVVTEKRVHTLSENQAVMSTTLERHLGWHDASRVIS